MTVRTLFLVIAAAALLLVVVQSAPASSDTLGDVARCHLPEVRGNCRALLPRWRYDPATGKCYEFKFGGCAGNGNNFRTQKECNAVCQGL